MNVYCCQLDIAWEDKAANYAKVTTLLAQARPSSGSLVVLPEMFATGFSMNVASLASDEPGATESFLADQAQQWGVYILGGVVTLNAAGRGLNQALVLNPKGSRLAVYSKIQLFSPGGELEHYQAGAQMVNFRLGDWVVAPFICYDLRFPELFRKATQHGAHLFVVVANWPSQRVEHWVTLLQARAIENQAYVVGVNRCGQDPHWKYTGRSLAVGPGGDIIAEAQEEEAVLQTFLDPEALRSLRAGLPFLQDIRSDYSQLPVLRDAQEES